MDQKLITEPKDYYLKSLYFNQYVGFGVGSYCYGPQIRTLLTCSLEACYYAPTYRGSAWSHIDNCFMYLKYIEDLSNFELPTLFGLIYPGVDMPISTYELREKCSVIYANKKYDWCNQDEDPYTLTVHKYLIGIGAICKMPSNTGGWTAIDDLLQLGIVADRDKINELKDRYRHIKYSIWGYLTSY